MQPETQEGLDIWRHKRLGSLKPEEKAKLFELVANAYLHGPKLADVAQQIGVAHRSLQRFMTTYNRKEWLIVQESKQWGRVWESEDGQRFDESLHNSAGYRMDRIDRERQKLR